MKTKYDKELLQNVVLESSSYSGVVRRLGLRMSGGNHSHIKKRIQHFGIDTSHFKKQHEFLKPGINKKSPKEILVIRTKGNREHAYKLRRALIESGVNYECNCCGVGSKWNGDELVLEVHHKNEDWLDNRIDNLEFLCPNCHSQKGKRIRNPARRKRLVSDANRCDCGEVIGRRSRHCKACHHKNREVIEWPDDVSLLTMVASQSMTMIGKNLGVSDNAIRKRLKKINDRMPM